MFSVPGTHLLEDTDAGGIVFYANYLKFFRARAHRVAARWIWASSSCGNKPAACLSWSPTPALPAPGRLDDERLLRPGSKDSGRASMTMANNRPS